MPRRRGGYAIVGTRSRRETEWFQGGLSQTTIAAGSTAALIGSLNAAGLAARPFTVIRTRGLITLNSDQAAVSEDQEIGYGHAVVLDQASAIGVTAVPTPLTDQASDLFYVYELLMTNFRFLSSIGFEQNGQLTRYFDSKAMRKVNGDQDIVITAETSATSEGCVVVDSFRFLVKLH